MQFKLQLPKKANKVESFIHSICDHYGFSDANISVDGDDLVISYPEDYSVNHSPSMEKCVDSVPGFQC